jgi:stage II sporulation protein D
VGSPNYSWRHTVAAINFAERLRTSGKPASGPVTRITDIQRLPSGRVSKFTVRTQAGPVTVSGDECRKLLGNDTIRSTWFSVAMRGDRIEFIGRGWGHGVGLCQWCSKSMADQGRSYEQILGHFYPGAALHR